jgi:hypothetical protein
MASNTPNLNLNRPDFGSERWDLDLNENFTILDNYISQLQTLILGVSGQSSIKDIVHEVLIQELSASAEADRVHNGTESFTLTQTDIDNMFVVLSNTPKTNEEYPTLKIEGAPAMIYGVDYILIDDNKISWNPANGIDNTDLLDCFIVGDEIIIFYNY